MKKNILLFGIVGLVFAGIGMYAGTSRVAPKPAASTATSTLFAQSLPDVEGKSHPLSQWKGKPLIVNFWATWCAPCVEEMPELSRLQTEIASRGMQIIGIGIDSATNIAQFAGKYKIEYPLYIAGMAASDLSRQMGNQAGGLPFTVLIGSDGQIKKTYLGRLKMNELRKDLSLIQGAI